MVSGVVKEIIAEKNVTQEDMAKLFNFNRSTIANYETKRNYPDVETLQKLADYFYCSTDYILGRSDIRKIDEEIKTINTANTKSRLKDDEKELIEAYSLLSIEEQGFLLKQIKALAETQRQITLTCEKGINVG